MHLNKKTNTIITVIFFSVLVAGLLYFLFTVFNSFVKPVFLGKPRQNTNVTLDKLLDEAADYIDQRGDLTLSSPSATLTNEEAKFTAEVINASGIPNAAQSIASELEGLGITVSKIGNGETTTGNILSLKDTSLALRDSITSKISTDAASVRVERLELTYPFDIRITIGR